MSSCDVSVIMAAYNGERYIEESIHSILNQTYSDLELVVIDDGSTDRTSQIVNDLRSRDSRILYAFQTNGKQGRARNNGIRRASGRLIAFCDQDDLWVNEKLSLQLQALSAARGVDVVFSDGFLFCDDRISDESTTFKTICGRYDGHTMFRLLFKENRIPVLSALVRKDAIVRAGLINEGLAFRNCDDWDLWLRLAHSGSAFLGMSQRLVRYRLHSQQASRDTNEMGKAEISVLEQFRNSEFLEKEATQAELSVRYGRLIDGLIKTRRRDEAVEWARRWSVSARGWRPRWRQLTCRLPPRLYEQVRSVERRLSWVLG